jgi:hypothetical protein
MATCPRCNKSIPHVILQEINASQLFAQTWRAISYCCPLCDVILSVGIDPIALKADTVAEILEVLGRDRLPSFDRNE